VGVTVLLVVLLAGVLLATLGARKGATGPASTRRRTVAKRKSWSPYWLLGGALIALVLMRFGVNWIVVAAGMVAAVLRSLLPLLRFLPMLESVRRARASAGTGGAGWGTNGQHAGAGRGPASGESSSSSAGSGRRPDRMTRHEALQVFGLREGASREDVQREYRRLMRQIHPDLGGSSYLAAKINEAKDVLA